MTTLEESNTRTREEMKRFDAALPAMLADPALAGRWVVFRDGKVLYADDDNRRAYDWAISNLGNFGGFVFMRVVPKRVVKIGGALLKRARS
jgi:hypothetical protein